MRTKYTKELLQEVVKNSNTLTEVLHKLKIRSAGGNFRTLHKYITSFNLDISHFSADLVRKNKLTNFNKKDLNNYLIVDSLASRSNIKKRLYQANLKEPKCEICGQNENWLGKPISLILDHINGIYNDNRLENLRIVCPNCNATFDTHCGKNNSKLNKIKSDLNIPLSESIDFRKIRTAKTIQSDFNRRKVIRPSYETLVEEHKINTYTAMGKKYKVSDVMIKKWIKLYEKNILK